MGLELLSEGCGVCKEGELSCIAVIIRFVVPFVNSEARLRLRRVTQLTRSRSSENRFPLARLNTSRNEQERPLASHSHCGTMKKVY